MKVKSIIISAAVIILIGGLAVIGHYAPKPVDWRLTFGGRWSTPYGCRIMRDMLPEIFRDGELTENNSVLLNSLYNDTVTLRNLIVITDSFYPDEFEINAILDYASCGNSVFISALDFSQKFSDTLLFSYSRPFFDTASLKDQPEFLKLDRQMFGIDTSFAFSKRMPESNITSYDTINTSVIGTDSKGKVNFIQIKSGSGNIFIHFMPLAFTNYHLLYGNYDYACAVMSVLPQSHIIWDEYYKPFRETDRSPVRYILRQPPLKSAYFVLVFTLVIYMVFGSKRLQRVIPVVAPPRNTSLEFVTTIGKLYHRGENHSDIARKKILYFNEFIRNRYSLRGTAGSDIRTETLAEKSGIEKGKIKRILISAESLPRRNQMSDQELIELHILLDHFYKNCK